MGGLPESPEAGIVGKENGVLPAAKPGIAETSAIPPEAKVWSSATYLDNPKSLAAAVGTDLSIVGNLEQGWHDGSIWESEDATSFVLYRKRCWCLLNH